MSAHGFTVIDDDATAGAAMMDVIVDDLGPSAALSGDLNKVEYHVDQIFGIEVPNHCPGVPDEVLNPASSWPSDSDYQLRYQDLAARFVDNFRKFEDETDSAIREAGPKL